VPRPEHTSPLEKKRWQPPVMSSAFHARPMPPLTTGRATAVAPPAARAHRGREPRPAGTPSRRLAPASRWLRHAPTHPSSPGSSRSTQKCSPAESASKANGGSWLVVTPKAKHRDLGQRRDSAVTEELYQERRQSLRSCISKQRQNPATVCVPVLLWQQRCRPRVRKGPSLCEGPGTSTAAGPRPRSRRGSGRRPMTAVRTP